MNDLPLLSCRRVGKKDPRLYRGWIKKALAQGRTSSVVEWERSGNRPIKTQEVHVK